jgi:hypothetical protein
MHDFKWAWKTLSAGEKVRRAIWSEGLFIYVNEHKILVSKLEATTLRQSVNRYDLEWYEMCASDWEKVT